MNNKLTLLFFTLIMCTVSSAQIQYGLKAGITHSFVREMQDDNIHMNMKTGFQVGASADIPLAKNFCLRPSLQYTQKGYKAVLGGLEGPSYWYRNYSLNYLELAADFVYNFHVGKATRIFTGAGPVAGYGLAGKGHGILRGTNGPGQVFSQEYTTYKIFRDEGVKRFDLGVDFLTGVQFGKVAITASYNHGLVNILNYDQGLQSQKNRSFALTVGYFINHLTF